MASATLAVPLFPAHDDQPPRLSSLAAAFPVDVLPALAADGTAAVAAALACSPIVMCVDKATAESAAGRTRLFTAFGREFRSMVSSPVSFLRQPALRYVVAVYAGTYGCVNALTTLEDRAGKLDTTTKTAGIAGVNLALGLWKDSAFARMFGGGASATAAVPAISIATWCCRDFFAMGGAFTVPPLVAAELRRSTGMDHGTSEVVAQFTAPLLAQPLVAPLALFGFVAHSQVGKPWSNHISIMRKEVLSCTAARLIRCLPPYCVGAMINKYVRRSMNPEAS